MELENEDGENPTAADRKFGEIKENNVAKTAVSSSAASNMNSNRAMAQYNADARLMAEFEQSGKSGKFFNYSKSVAHAPNTLSTEEEMTAYLSKIQRGSLVQAFGCMLAIEEPSFKVIGYSENCFDMLGLKSVVEGKNLMGLIGVDARTLFTSSSRASLAKAVAAREISFLNPIWVHSCANHKPFYAILHRIDVGIVIDLEPARAGDPAMLHASAVQSQKLAVRAISRLQSLPGGDVGVLCDTVVEDVQKLTGYDRVMVYKFHDDNHGEVVSEIRRSDLEPYLGLHYPATDIPQAARFLFMQNRVRMICDCRAKPVKIVQSKELKQPLCLVNSTLRSPHGCHTQYMENMGSMASLVMAVVVNSGELMNLWGLVVCHHSSSRCVPFPLRYACEFLMQAFGLQLNMELQLASQLVEKKTLRMQTLLCDMLLRGAPFGIVNQSPNIMDLVNCNGAALYYRGKCWSLGVTPTEAQMRDIAEWLLNSLEDSTGLSTDCLADAGYPGAALLGDAVCGMIAAKITSTDFLFWFRSHTAKEIKWGGAKHHPEEKDDGGKMHPRSSFIAFLEVVKSRSLQWEVAEINAIHSLQLILRNSFLEIEERGPKPEIFSQQNGSDNQQLVELTSAAAEMVRLIETATVPIFGVDSSGWINGWNTKMYELTGLTLSEALGKSLINDVIHEDSREAAKILLQRALHGEEDKNVEVKLLTFGTHSQNAVILASACTSRNYKNDVVGVCFIGQDVTAEKSVMDKFIRLEGDYKMIMQSLNPLIPPIFASDENACCCEWNAAMEKLTGWMKHEIIGKLLPGEIFGSFCRLEGQDELTKFMILLYRAISGQETQTLPFGFFDRRGEFVDVLLTANKKTEEGGNVNGCFCFLQTVAKQQQAILDKLEVKEKLSKLKELAYIRQEMKNPLNGIRFTHELMGKSGLSEDQKRFLETSEACERQILSIIDPHFEIPQEGELELKMEEFILGNVINAVVSQAMILLNEKNLRLVLDVSERIRTLCLYGDQIKLQLALSALLLTVVEYTSCPDGWVEILVSPSPGSKQMQDGNEFVHLQFRMAHPGKGLPSSLIEDMFAAQNNWLTQRGIALNIAQKLLITMNGNVRYIRDQCRCYFLVDLELIARKSDQ
ncbi:Phytochrome E isoform 1 [Dorcoceras hygrometricum]|uniref:Phytochrome n=1 Tax=Dorcoceras hygrometricum TaxID=472368 RepID=A0A2Z7DAA7_9LAMI|nr:Phytochrome E isoform 1 [Dorcoceras hygrometricum]